MLRRTLLGLAAATAASRPAWAAAGGEVEGSLLIQPHFGTIFWTVVTFLCLLIVLRKVAWKPLLDAIEARERGIQETLERTRLEREEAEALVTEQRDLLEQARRERAQAVEAGRQDADRLKAEILEEARRQREQLLAQTEVQIASGLRQARAELRGMTAELAIQAAAKLLAKSLDDPSQRRLVEDYLAELEAGAGPADPRPS
jgi:F-type H+-transporting ATPase subunit b